MQTAGKSISSGASGTWPEWRYLNRLRIRMRQAPFTEQRGMRSLKVLWYGIDLENTAHPNYFGVTLDRMLSYKYSLKTAIMLSELLTWQTMWPLVFILIM